MPSYALVSLAMVGAAILSACQFGPSAPTPAQTYPAEIVGAGESKNFPLQVGPYNRGEFRTYEPGMANHSVGYDRFDKDVQNSVTLYFYPRGGSIEEHFKSVKRDVYRARPDTVQTAERTVTLTKAGISYQALYATFEFTEYFSGTRQLLFSELILVDLSDHWFKVRSSSPVAQKALTPGSTLTLLEGVNWAYWDRPDALPIRVSFSW
jgi:hypothetical protein